MSMTSAEQRTTRRFDLSLPLTVKAPDGSESVKTVETKDVSSRGVFFYLDSDVQEGSQIEFTLTLPPEITLTEKISVHCLGRVVRVKHSAEDKRMGVACVIEHYDFVASGKTPAAGESVPPPPM